MSAEAMENLYFEIGTAKRKITPEIPVPLAGFASRNGKVHEGIQEDLWVRVLRVKQGNEKILFIQGDLIWWDPQTALELRDAISKKTGYPVSHIILTATHNHSGPATGDTFVPELGIADTDYVKYLKEQTMDAVETAEKNRNSVICKVRTGVGAFNVYRRKKTAAGIQMMPEYGVHPDDTLTMITFEDREGEIRAFGIHYSCHATLCGENKVFTDYPGLAVRFLEEKYTNAFGFFWQGCAADIRPNSVIGMQFHRCSYEEAYEFTRQFTDVCEQILKKPGRSILPDLNCKVKTVLLPIDLPEEQNCAEKMIYSKDLLMRHWAACVMRRKTNELSAELCRVSFGTGLVFYGISAEVAQEYGIYVRSLEEGAVCCGYTNGMNGYLCTEKQIAEGGYEPAEAAFYFGVNGTFSPKTEFVLKKALSELSNTIK